MPFYVTRKNAEGLSATWSVNAWIGLVLLILLQLNVLLWSIVGIYEAGRVILGW